MGYKKGLQPLMHTVRVVMRNGASFNIQTTMRRAGPYMLQTVSANEVLRPGRPGAGPGAVRSVQCDATSPNWVQDTSNNPVYTGEAAGLSIEDKRMQVGPRGMPGPRLLVLVLVLLPPPLQPGRRAAPPCRRLEGGWRRQQLPGAAPLSCGLCGCVAMPLRRP